MCMSHPAHDCCDRLSPYWAAEDEDVDTADISHLPEEALRGVEADTYWCLGRLLDGIQVSGALQGWAHGAQMCTTGIVPGPFR